MLSRPPIPEPRPRRGWRWALLGAVTGVLLAVVLFAPQGLSGLMRRRA